MCLYDKYKGALNNVCLNQLRDIYFTWKTSNASRITALNYTKHENKHVNQEYFNNTWIDNHLLIIWLQLSEKSLMTLDIDC